MNRRQFLQGTGGLILGVLTGNTIKNEIDKHNTNKTLTKKSNDLEWMLNNVEDHIHMAEHEFKYTIPTSSEKEHGHKVKGVGIVVDGLYLTPNHVGCLDALPQRTPFGIMYIPIELKSEKHKVGDVGLDKIISSKDPDVAIFKPNAPLKEFPYDVSYEVKKGDTIYVLGNPQLIGLNIRKGMVSDVDDFGEQTTGCFGIDVGLIPGDSGSPVLNEDLNLIGIANFGAYGSLGYCTKMKCFDDVYKNRKEVKNVN